MSFSSNLQLSKVICIVYTYLPYDIYSLLNLFYVEFDGRLFPAIPVTTRCMLHFLNYIIYSWLLKLCFGKNVFIATLENSSRKIRALIG